MAHVCPWWFTPVFDNPLRRLIQPPGKTLESVVRRGQRVLDLGCGMGFFALEAARRVGPDGRVIAVDIQQESLDRLKRRAARVGLGDRIETSRQDATDLSLEGPVDAAYAIWSLHEMNGVAGVADRVARLLPTGGRMLIVEPLLHVSGRRFESIREAFMAAGFVPGARVSGGLSRGLVLAAS